ncbi:MAG: NAD(P)/FAD-dependent oxidoreductase [Longimicrobiales bacterium]
MALRETSQQTLADCDVAIVGAGPAGSATAIACARGGLDVLLLDRATFPRPKPCGDCLSPESNRLLDELGVLDAILDERPARLEGWRIVSPDGHAFEGRFRDFVGEDTRVRYALAVSRDRLDTVLLHAARAAGARFHDDAHVVSIRAEDGNGAGLISGTAGHRAFTIRARTIVGADGLRSVVARRAGMTRIAGKRLRKVSLTAHVTGIRGPHGMGEMHVADGLCLGLAPVESWGQDTRPLARGIAYNVTLVADAVRYGRALAAGPSDFFLGAVRGFRGLRHRLGRLQPIGPEGRGRDGWLLRSGPFDAPTRRVTAGNVALVGDAAGYYDPFTGQGIYQALAGAERLAAAITQAHRDRVPVEAALRAYARDLRRLLRGPRALQHVIEIVLSRPRIADRATAWLADRPGAIHALLATTGDLAPVRSLFAPVTLRALTRSTRRHSTT